MIRNYCLRKIFTLLLSCSFFSALTQAYPESIIPDSFKSLLDSITINLNSGNSKKNILYINALKTNGFLKTLSCYELGIINHKLGQAYYITSNHQLAYSTFKNKTIAIWDSCQSQSLIEEAHTYYAAALSGQYLNQHEDAINLLNKALELYEADSTYTEFNKARKYHGAGRIYAKANDYELAKIYYKKAIDIFSKSKKGGNYLSMVYNDLGVIYQNTSKYQLAIKQFRKSLSFNDTYKTDNLHNISNAYIKLGDFKNAEKYAALTYASAIELGITFKIARTLELIGYVYYLQEKYDQAIKFYQDQLSQLQNEIKNNETVRSMANAYENMALCYKNQHNFELALDSNNKALELMFYENSFDHNHNPIINNNSTRNDLETIVFLSTKVSILKNRRQESNDNIAKQEEVDLHLKIDSLFIKIFPSISFNRSKLNLINTVSTYYEDAISTTATNYIHTLSEYDFQLSYYFATKLKAITLRSSIRKESILNKSDKLGLVRIKKKIDSLKLIYYNSPEEISLISSEIIKQQRSLHQFEQGMTKRYPELSNTTIEDISVDDIKNIHNSLKFNQLLIEYFQGDDAIHQFIITKDTFAIHKIPTDESFKNLLTQYKAANQSGTHISVKEYHILARQIFDLLLGHSTHFLKEPITKLLIVPDGILHTIPFEALCHKESRYLIEDFEISYAYSYHIKNSKKSKPKNSYLGYATRYTNDLNKKIKHEKAVKTDIYLSDIPHSIEEIKASAQLFKGLSMLNEQATKASFIEKAKDAKIIHLSTHGLVDYEVPENSNLLFYDGVEDFILHSSEINSLNLNTDLVVLSACQSAAGKTLKAEGVQGLSRSFILAGANSVISSLWNASDYSSSLVLPLFFKNYSKEQNKSKSLRFAKLDYLASARPSLKHPYYWSNLILIVNPSNDEILSNRKQYGYYLLLGALGIAFLFGLYNSIKEKN